MGTGRGIGGCGIGGRRLLRLAASIARVAASGSCRVSLGIWGMSMATSRVIRVRSIGGVIGRLARRLPRRSRKRRRLLVVSVVSALERELEGYELRLPGISGSALAASALELAAQMDDPTNSSTSKSMCGRELREHLRDLRDELPPVQAKDGLASLQDDFTSRRQAKIAGEPAA